MIKFKVGDKVKINKECANRFCDYSTDKIYTIELSEYDEGLCIYSNRYRHGWIHKGMGLYDYITKVNNKNVVGGELL